VSASGQSSARSPTRSLTPNSNGVPTPSTFCSWRSIPICWPRYRALRPEHIHIVLGDNRRVSLRLADYRSYVRHLRERLEGFIASPAQTRAGPVPACDLCRWREHCAREWDRADSLCLLPGIRKSQRHKLEAAGAATISSLAVRSSRVPKLADETLAKLHIQAQLRSARRAGGKPAYQLRTSQPDKGLSRLPKPEAGDLFYCGRGVVLVDQ